MTETTRTSLVGPLPGVTFEVDETGQGDTVVIWLHGEWGPFDDPPFEASAARVLSLHLPGWGLSKGAERFDSIQDFATAHWWAIDQLGVSEAILVGHGFGATLAAEIAVQQPQRVARLVLAAPFGIVDEADPGADLFGLMPRDLLPHLYADPTGPLVERHYPRPDDAHERGLASIRRVEVLSAAGHFLFPLPDTGIRDRLYRLADTPVRLLWGEKDGLVPASVVAAWEELLPHASSQAIADVAHMLVYEADILSEAVESSPTG